MRTGAGVYLRVDGRWEARYQKGRDENGKIIYGYAYGSTQEEAEQKRAAALHSLGADQEQQRFVLAAADKDRILPEKEYKKDPQKNRYEKRLEPLTDAEIGYLDEVCRKSRGTNAIVFYLSLHMGLLLSECAALKFGDLDIERKIVHVRNEIQVRQGVTLKKADAARDVPMPLAVELFLTEKKVQQYAPSRYILNACENLIGSTATIKWAFRKIAPQLAHIDPTALRCTFLKKCLEADLTVESIVAITGIDRAFLYKWYGSYIRADVNAIFRVHIGGAEVRDRQEPDRNGIYRKQLNLLILGAGSHGHTVQETAETLGIFGKIRFLDDTAVGEDILDTCEHSGAYVNEFPCAFVAVGDNEKRRALAEKLRREGYMLPRIVHPHAAVSKNAHIVEGTIVMAQATVNASTIGDMCIVASNALVNSGAQVGDCSHIDCGAMVMKGARVPPMAWIPGGKIFE